MTKEQKEVSDNLIEEWQKIKKNSKPPYIFPGDKEFFGNEKNEEKYVSKIESFSEFIEKSYCKKGEEKKWLLNLLPIPYIGNLKNSSIFILELNPGLGPGDYFAEIEKKDEEYIKALKNNLLQNGKNRKFPFIFLNPKFSWHPGFIYWNDPKRFGTIIQKLAKDCKLEYKEAASFLAKHISVLELVPYHSKKGRISKRLESLKAITKYVKEIIIPKAKDNKATVIVVRGEKYWNIEEEKKENIIIYKPPKARQGYLSICDESGKAILDKLKEIKKCQDKIKKKGERKK